MYRQNASPISFAGSRESLAGTWRGNRMSAAESPDSKQCRRTARARSPQSNGNQVCRSYPSPLFAPGNNVRVISDCFDQVDVSRWFELNHYCSRDYLDGCGGKRRPI